MSEAAEKGKLSHQNERLILDPFCSLECEKEPFFYPLSS